MLATGGIVDKATLAMIGERGREAVMPLERNTGWIDELAHKITASQSNTTNYNQYGAQRQVTVLQVGNRAVAQVIQPTISNGIQTSSESVRKAVGYVY